VKLTDEFTLDRLPGRYRADPPPQLIRPGHQDRKRPQLVAVSWGSVEATHVLPWRDSRGGNTPNAKEFRTARTKNASARACHRPAAATKPVKTVRLGQSLVLAPSTGLTVRPPKSPQRAVELQPVRAPDTAADGFSLRSRR
jgi:hypothetical protein